MQLEVTDTEARIVGTGYGQEIGGAFSLLVFDWEATIYLDRAELALDPGDYRLQFVDAQLRATRDQRGYAVPDQGVRVVVVSVVEEEGLEIP